MQLRNTHQKEIIREIMHGEGVHMHAEDVLAKAREKDSSISQATIYRNLKTLVEQGKIQKIEGNGQSYYDANPIPHDHFICSNCGEITDVQIPYDASLDEKVATLAHARIIKHSTTYEGICEKCLKDTKEKKDGIKRK